MHENGRALSLSSSPAWRIQLLGELRVTFAGQEIPRTFPPKIGGLLGYLALTHSVGTRRQRAAARARQGDLEGAIAAAQRAVHADPLQEEAHYELIRQYAAAGQTAAARRHYLEMERLLRVELEVTPSRSFQELLEAGE